MANSLIERMKSAKQVDSKIMQEATRYYNEKMIHAEMDFQSKNRESEIKASYACLTT